MLANFKNAVTECSTHFVDFSIQMEISSTSGASLRSTSSSIKAPKANQSSLLNFSLLTVSFLIGFILIPPTSAPPSTADLRALMRSKISGSFLNESSKRSYSRWGKEESSSCKSADSKVGEEGETDQLSHILSKDAGRPLIDIAPGKDMRKKIAFKIGQLSKEKLHGSSQRWSSSTWRLGNWRVSNGPFS